MALKLTARPASEAPVDALEELKELDFLVVNETLTLKLTELAIREDYTHEYDFLAVEPHRWYRQLRELGLVEIINHDETGHYRIARISELGHEYLDIARQRRKTRRRRRAR